MLDEPTNALDVEARRLLWRAVRGYVSGGRSVVLATHDLTEAERLGDRIAVFRGGRIVETGTVSELVTRHAPGSSFEEAVLALAGIAPDVAGVA